MGYWAVVGGLGHEGRYGLMTVGSESAKGRVRPKNVCQDLHKASILLQVLPFALFLLHTHRRHDISATSRDEGGLLPVRLRCRCCSLRLRQGLGDLQQVRDPLSAFAPSLLPPHLTSLLHFRGAGASTKHATPLVGTCRPPKLGLSLSHLTCSIWHIRLHICIILVTPSGVSSSSRALAFRTAGNQRLRKYNVAEIHTDIVRTT